MEANVVWRPLLGVAIYWKGGLYNLQCYVRALRGKHKSAFLTKLKGVVTTFCDMIKHECPEGELVAPKYVSGSFTCYVVYHSSHVIPTVASYGATIFPFHIPRFSLCDEQEGSKV